MTKATLLFFLFPLLLFAQSNKICLTLDEGYPMWLKTSTERTDQTSGIAFIKHDRNKKLFLLADDIGDLKLLTLSDDTLFRITNIPFEDSVKNVLLNFPKADFEEIVYDRYENKYFLSIEGNGKNFKKFVGIYELLLDGVEPEQYKVKSLQKIIFQPEEKFTKYTAPNIGYEGIASDANYFYLGLEGFVKENIFADSTLIFIASKKDKKILKEISTYSLRIESICGLFSDKNYSLWGIDRNNRKIFHILFDEDFQIKDYAEFNCTGIIPGYKNLNYSASFESITMDDENFLYIVDDPWKINFIPEKHILDQTDNMTISNFNEFIPIIYKFNKIHHTGE